MAKISIIGAGHVGASFGYSLALSGLATELLLVDKDARRAEGEALDIAHAMAFGRPAPIRAGAIADVAGSAITVIAAGANQHPGESRLDLLGRNAGIVERVAAEVAAINPAGLIVVATNPVDVLARIAHEASGLPPGHVIGSGTLLDTARLRHLLGQHLGLDPRDVQAQVLGEHGDSSVVAWSSASVGGVPLAAAAAARGVAFDAGVRRGIEAATRNAAYAIVEGKGSTYYAIAAGLVRLVEAVLRDEKVVLTVSAPGGSALRRPDAERAGVERVWLGLPAVIGATGLLQTLPLGLDDGEASALLASAQVLGGAYDRLRAGG